MARSWTGRDLGDLNLHLLPLVGELTILAQRHLAYPPWIKPDPGAAHGSRPTATAALDEALWPFISVAGFNDVERERRLDVSVTRPLRQAVSDYPVNIGVRVHRHELARSLALRPLGIVDEGGLGRRAGGAHRNPRPAGACCTGYVLADGWTWSAVCDDVDADEDDPGTATEACPRVGSGREAQVLALRRGGAAPWPPSHQAAGRLGGNPEEPVADLAGVRSWPSSMPRRRRTASSARGPGRRAG